MRNGVRGAARSEIPTSLEAAVLDMSGGRPEKVRPVARIAWDPGIAGHLHGLAVAGTFAHELAARTGASSGLGMLALLARVEVSGPSRVQSDGVIDLGRCTLGSGGSIPRSSLCVGASMCRSRERTRGSGRHSFPYGKTIAGGAAPPGPCAGTKTSPQRAS